MYLKGTKQRKPSTDFGKPNVKIIILKKIYIINIENKIY